VILQNPKLFSLEDAIKIRNQRRDCNIVLTNGCFDLLHAGHIFSLQQAAEFGELWVAINSDASIRELKGVLRPVICEQERAYMLSALACVSGIFIFDSKHLVRELKLFGPDIYVKSGNYSLETLNAEEHFVLKEIQSKVKFVSFLQGISTSIIIDRVQKLASL
jgi:rfaE bifunctional protein nucleotidyltransferase chain/domain